MPRDKNKLNPADECPFWHRGGYCKAGPVVKVGFVLLIPDLQYPMCGGPGNCKILEMWKKIENLEKEKD